MIIRMLKSVKHWANVNVPPTKWGPYIRIIYRNPGLKDFLVTESLKIQELLRPLVNTATHTIW